MEIEDIKLIHKKDGSYQEIYQNEVVDIPQYIADENDTQGVEIIEE